MPRIASFSRFVIFIGAIGCAGNDASVASPAGPTNPTPVPAAAPTITVTAAPAATTSEPFARFSFTASEGARTECRVDDADWVACSSPHVVMPRTGTDLPLGVGTHHFQVRAMAASGATSAAVTREWNVVSVFTAPMPALARTTQTPARADAGGWLGIFRINCEFAHAAYDDPIIYPNRAGAAHLHNFYGYKTVSAATTAESLFVTGSSSCQGDNLNRSSYWVPTLLAPSATDPSGWQVVQALAGADSVAHELFYYSVAVGDPRSVRPYPVGLRMIAGTAATMPGTPQSSSVARWHCLSWQSSDGANPRWSPSIPECTIPDQVRFDLFFPSCWNGRDLDSPDHKSHMAYPVNVTGRNSASCPVTHPVPVPRVSYHYSFPVLPSNADRASRSSRRWRLASDNFTVGGDVAGGWSLHGDWFNGWHPEVLQALITNCLHAGLDCHDGNLANGWRLGGVSKGSGTLPGIVNAGMGGTASLHAGMHGALGSP